MYNRLATCRLQPLGHLSTRYVKNIIAKWSIFQTVPLHDTFFAIFLVTILMVRIILYIKPLPAPTIRGWRTHHWMYGLVLIILSVIFKIIPLFAIGLAFFVDELTFLLMRGKTHADNYSRISLVGTFFFVVIIYLFRSSLISLF